MERWKINLYTIWFSQVLSLMSFSFGMPFLPFYIQELGVVDPDKIKMYSGILNSAPAISMAIMAPIWGIIADKYGRKLMLLRAMFFATFIIGGMGLATRVEHLVVLRLLQGVFTGTVTAASVLVAANTPRERLSFALGFLSSSTFLGQSIGPVIGGFVAELVGYRVSFYVGALLMLIDFFLVLFIVKEHNVHSEKDKNKAKEKASLLSVFTSMTIAMLLVLLFMRIGRSIFSPYLPIYVQEVRASVEGTARITGIINGIVGFMTAVSALTLSRLGDKYDKMKLLMVLLLSGVVLSLPLALINNLWVFAIFYGILFFAIGGIEPIIMSVTTEATPRERRGMLFGIQGTVGGIGIAAAPLMGGVVSIQYSTKAVIWLIPVFLVLAIITVAVIKIQKKKSHKGKSDKVAITTAFF
jgi:DHA1 family multidrug resistance protein-like MFS transporter